MAILECNKDEAIRAKEIAERKFIERDYYGAKKFAMKAQNLYPDLDGLAPMLKTFDVYISAQTKTSSGEVDWYGVLGVQPWVDDDTVRKQYHTLALVLHPDKNKSVGADGAFKLVSDAWIFLSDKAKRLAYNEKLNVLQQKISSETRSQSIRPTENGFHYGNSASISSRPHSKSARGRPASVPSSHQKPNTFWTICNSCKTQYEYMRVYLNQTLLCPNCNEAFFAAERAPPANVVKTTNLQQQKYPNSGHHSARSTTPNIRKNWEDFANNSQDIQWNHVSRMAGAEAKWSASSSVGQTVSVDHQAYAQLNTKWKQVRAVSEQERGYVANRGRNSSLEEHVLKRISTYYGSPDANHGASAEGLGSGSAGRSSGEADRSYGLSGVNNRSVIARELSSTDIRNLLLSKAYNAICKQLQEWRLNPVKLQGNKKQRKMNDDSIGTNGENHKSFGDADKVSIEPMLITVPDSDFHNFDLDRSEASFGDDQVWAAYDEKDGMPRYYARIQKVVSLKQFKMKISWLNSRSSSEFGSLDWVGAGFTKTCGEFRAGRYEMSKRLNSFSHKVKWSKGTRGMIRVFPMKGDIWAIYRNWSADWNKDTPQEVVQQYDMVEILDEYTEEQGISVIPLIKVPGFKTVFRKHTNPDKVRRIPREEMLRFSHQVPDHVLTGEEADNAPKGCWELDPAATPVEFLQVITDAEEEQGLTQLDGKAEDSLGPSGGVE